MNRLLACAILLSACEPLDVAATQDPSSCEGCHPVDAFQAAGVGFDLYL